jgi:hypothetical protein
LPLFAVVGESFPCWAGGGWLGEGQGSRHSGYPLTR